MEIFFQGWLKSGGQVFHSHPLKDVDLHDAKAVTKDMLQIVKDTFVENLNANLNFGGFVVNVQSFAAIEIKLLVNGEVIDLNE